IVLYGRLLLAPGPVVATATPSGPGLLSPTPTPSPASPAEIAPTPASFARFVTPTPEPDGRVLMLAPQAGDVAWWTDADARRVRVGDSFLYAGHV
ncbi:MAG: hypothetical protein NZP34_10460, partial [Caldilineales bacterium]|nr:hypothetical protein [Caldilineales bacterium]